MNRGAGDNLIELRIEYGGKGDLISYLLYVTKVFTGCETTSIIFKETLRQYICTYPIVNILIAIT